MNPQKVVPAYIHQQYMRLKNFFFPQRKPGLTGRGMYELKPECAKEFNLYFYHFSRAEQSKVIEKIKSVLRKGCLEFFCFYFVFS